MKARSKFYGIEYPIFALKNKPFNYTVTVDTIGVQLKEFGEWHVIDRFTNEKSLVSRYIETKDDIFCFDYTCLNISQLISKPIKWGIDSAAKIYNLENKQEFIARNEKVIKVKNNLIWVNTVSYPFTLPKNMIDKNELIQQYATIVYIDDVWVLHKFTSFRESIDKLKL